MLTRVGNNELTTQEEKLGWPVWLHRTSQLDLARHLSLWFLELREGTWGKLLIQDPESLVGIGMWAAPSLRGWDGCSSQRLESLGPRSVLQACRSLYEPCFLQNSISLRATPVPLPSPSSWIRIQWGTIHESWETMLSPESLYYSCDFRGDRTKTPNSTCLHARSPQRKVAKSSSLFLSLFPSLSPSLLPSLPPPSLFFLLLLPPPSFLLTLSLPSPSPLPPLPTAPLTGRNVSEISASTTLSVGMREVGVSGYKIWLPMNQLRWYKTPSTDSRKTNYLCQSCSSFHVPHEPDFSSHAYRYRTHEYCSNVAWFWQILIWHGFVRKFWCLHISLHNNFLSSALLIWVLSSNAIHVVQCPL